MDKIKVICMIYFITVHVWGQHIAPENKTIANYDPTELLSKIFNATVLPRTNRRLVKFEEGVQADIVSFKEIKSDGSNSFYKNPYFIDNNIEQHYQGGLPLSNSEVNFQDTKKKIRKKRKPKQPYPQYQGVGQPYYGPGPISPYYGDYDTRPTLRPRPQSIASEALSRITEALTSIALYDDRQCVARLLCEAAGGGSLGTLGSNGIVQAISGLQPLFTLLSAYNGVSSNPLFVFGRAVFLGMSSKSNTAVCRYGYPLCPTDTEQLVHYLNNHNGGFFRFFNSPQQGQNVEQFYNHLSDSFNQEPNSNQNGYSVYNTSPNDQHYGFLRPNPYTTHHQNYGYGLLYNTNYNQIQKRIQNKPLQQSDDSDYDNPKWTFPNNNIINNNYYDNVYADINAHDPIPYENSNKKGKILKFPDYNTQISNNNDGENKFSFPETNNRVTYNYNYVKPNNNFINNNQYKLYNGYNSYNNYGDHLQTVYVVRGNGDPNRPEIVKVH